jgi:hypothetical protein
MSETDIEFAPHLPTVLVTRRTTWTAAELLAEQLPEQRWAIDGLLAEGLAFFAGAPKLGKSWMALGLGIAVASGGYALGKIPVEQGDVLYLALEDNARRLQSRLRMLLGNDAAPHRLHLQTEWSRLDEGGVDQLTAWLDDHPETRLVIVDVWTRVRPWTRESGSHYQADYEAASLLQAIAISRGIAIVAVYHTRKAESTDFVETVQGTFGTAGAADSILVVKRTRGEADATLHVTGRDVIEQELALRFDHDTGGWTFLGDAAEYALGETRKTLLEALREHGRLKPVQASEVTGVERELVRKTLQRMFRDGQIGADDGHYLLLSPVPGVPESQEAGTVGHLGQPSRGPGSENLGLFGQDAA